MGIEKRPAEDEDKDYEDKDLDVGGQSNLTTCATWTMLILVSLVVLGCFVIWVVVHPVNLEYTVEDAFVTDFDIKTFVKGQPVKSFTGNAAHSAYELSNSFNLTAVRDCHAISRANAKFFFNTSFRNPNYRLNFTYGTMKTVVFRGDTNLTSTTLPGFFQEKNSTEYTSFIVSIRNEKMNCSVTRGLVLQKHARIYIRVDLTLTTHLNFTARHWKSEIRKIEIYCANVMVQLLPSNSTFERSRCTVQIM